MLTDSARRIRLVATGVILVALFATAAWGQDDHFPFAPFRMYSTTTPASGSITAIKFYAKTADGTRIEIAPDELGVRRAEVLGRAAKLRKDPGILRDLALHYQARPGAPRLASLSLVFGVYELGDARPVAYSEHTEAKWRAR